MEELRGTPDNALNFIVPPASISKILFLPHNQNKQATACIAILSSWLDEEVKITRQQSQL